MTWYHKTMEFVSGSLASLALPSFILLPPKLPAHELADNNYLTQSVLARFARQVIAGVPVWSELEMCEEPHSQVPFSSVNKQNLKVTTKGMDKSRTALSRILIAFQILRHLCSADEHTGISQSADGFCRNQPRPELNTNSYHRYSKYISLWVNFRSQSSSAMHSI